MHISVSSWSFHRLLYGGTFRLPDVPLAVFECGIRHVELNDLFLTSPPPGRLARLMGAPAPQGKAPDYGRKALMQLRQGRLRSGTRLACWTIETDLTVATKEERDAQRAYIATAIQAARFLGAPILRLTLGGASGDHAGLSRAVDLLRSVLPVAMASNVRLAIENHGGLSSETGSLESVIGAFGSIGGSGARPLGVCLDLGHFADGQHAAGVARLAPLAIHVHAPARSFDERGDETTIDYGMSMSALRSAAYDAAISIEYTGDGDPRDGILKTKTLITRHWDSRAVALRGL
jgi:sugar phosphate isomerase/epimerase